MDDAEGRIAVLHRLGDEAERDEIVDLLELDFLAAQLLMNAPEALDPSVDSAHRHLRLGELRGNRALQLLDEPFGRAAFGIDPAAQRLVGLRIEIAERQLLELVLDLAHPEAVGDGRVDVARLLGDLHAALLGQMVERPHVVEAIGELDEDDADVVDHRQEHLAEVLRLALFARRERDGAELGDAFDDVRHFRTEELLDALDRRERVLHHVVEQAGGDGDGVELHVGEKVGDGERMNEVRLAGMAHLSAVLERREDVRAAQELDVSVRAVRPDFFQQVLEANHGNRCLSHYRARGEDARFRPELPICRRLDLPFFASLYWPGFGDGKFQGRGPNAIVFERLARCGGGARPCGDSMHAGRPIEGEKIDQGGPPSVPAAGLQESGAVVRGYGRGRPQHGDRVLLSGQQLRPAVQAEQERRP